MPTISIIAAVADNYAIGYKKEFPGICLLI